MDEIGANGRENGTMDSNDGTEEARREVAKTAGVTHG